MMGKLLAAMGVLLVGVAVALVVALRPTEDEPVEIGQPDDPEVAAIPVQQPAPRPSPRVVRRAPPPRRSTSPEPALQELARSPVAAAPEQSPATLPVGRPPKNAAELELLLSDLVQQGVDVGRFEGALVAKGINAIGAMRPQLGVAQANQMQREFLKRVQGAAGVTNPPSPPVTQPRARVDLKKLAKEISALPNQASRQKHLSKYLGAVSNLHPEERAEYLDRLQRALETANDK